MPAGHRGAGPQPLDGALEADRAARRTGAGAEVDDVIGDGDRLRLVLHDEHRVALVPQLQQQVVHALDVVGMQADRGLVEDVGGVGERRTKVTDHLDALRFAARQRPRRPIEGEVTEPDLHERVERVAQRGQQGRDRGLLQLTHPLGEIGDLHRADIGDVDLLDLGRAGRLAEPGAAAVGTGRERHHPFHERTDVRLHRLRVLRQHRLLDLRDQPFVGEVDAVDLDLGRLLVEQVVELPLGELADRFVRVEVAASAEDAAVPTVHAVAGDRERTFVERLAVVVQLRQVEVGHRAPALAARTHAAGDAEAASLLHGLPGALERDRAGATDRRHVEGERLGRADVGCPEAAEEDAEHGVGVGGGADRGAGVGTHPLLVDDDRGRQSLEHVDVGPRQCRHEALHERAVGLIDHPLRLRRDRAEHQRALARAGEAGEHREAALRELHADVLEVVHAGAVHADQVVAVGDVPRRRRRVGPRGRAHAVSISRAPGPTRRRGLASAGSI